MADIDISNALDVDTSDVQATVTSISSGKRPVNLAASSAGPATKKRKAASLIIGDGDDKVSGDDALGPMSDNDKDSAGDSEASKKDQPALATKADDRRPPPRGMPAVWAKVNPHALCHVEPLLISRIDSR